ncbi:MAG TPA: alpha/beta hydrolase [Nitrospirota bacterium]|nr:alpha/beta hydrolase [Nitrospirota bacterium]
MRLSKVLIAYPLLFSLCLFFSGCGFLFFYPQKQLHDNLVARLFSPEDVYFETPDKLTLHGWFFRAENKDARATILVLHGNAENLSTHVNSVLWLIREGFNLFIFDYRGYGKSQGSPSIEGVCLDAEAALKTLLSLPYVDKEQIIVLGQSIGGAIAVYTVANTPYKDRIAALIIDSAFSSYRGIAREKLAQFFITWPLQYPLSYLVGDSYSPIRWIGKVSSVPVLIIHGDKDSVVPMHHGRMLYEAARDPKEFWETTTPGHVMSFADADVRERLVRYLTVKLQEK